MFIVTPDIPNWVILVGAGIGSTISGFIAHRAKKTSDRSAEAVNKVSTELEGPGLEPSLRQMVRESTNVSLDLYTKLHDEHMMLRKEFVERISSLEKSDTAQSLVMTAVKSLENQVGTLLGVSNRLGLNMHKVANHVQCQLLTMEEANEIMEKRTAEEQARVKAETKIP